MILDENPVIQKPRTIVNQVTAEASWEPGREPDNGNPSPMAFGKNCHANNKFHPRQCSKKTFWGRGFPESTLRVTLNIARERSAPRKIRLKSGQRASKILKIMTLRIWPKVGFMGKPKIIKISGAFLYLSLRLSPSNGKHNEVSFPQG